MRFTCDECSEQFWRSMHAVWQLQPSTAQVHGPCMMPGADEPKQHMSICKPLEAWRCVLCMVTSASSNMHVG